MVEKLSRFLDEEAVKKVQVGYCRGSTGNTEHSQRETVAYAIGVR